MKRPILLMFALALFRPAESFAAPAVELRLGGYMMFYGAFAGQKKTTAVPAQITYPPLAARTKTVGDYNKADLMGDAEIWFSGEHAFDGERKIAAMVQLKGGTDSGTSTHVIDQTYMTFDSEIGRIVAGNVKNASNMMAVRSPTVSPIGFQETDFTRMIAVPALFAYNKATYATLDDISTKLVYITPEIGGFSLGVALMPGNKVKGRDADNLLIPTDGMKIFKRGADATALYTRKFGKVRTDVSASLSVYKPNFAANGIADAEKNVNEYGAGAVFAVENWSFGGSYHFINSPKSVAQAAAAVQTMGAHGASWETGVKYEKGKFAASANFMRSRADSFTADGKDVYTQCQISARYAFADGVDGFIDAARLRFDAAGSDPARSNKGTAVALGVNLTF